MIVKARWTANPRPRAARPLLFCFDGLEETLKVFPVLGEHTRKPDSIPHGSVTGDDLSGCEQGRVVNLESDVKYCPDLQSKHHLDIKTAKAQVGSFTANRSLGCLLSKLHRDTHLQARVISFFLTHAGGTSSF